MGLLSKVGGVAKEAGRGMLVNAVLKATGNTAMSGQVQYPEYEYDANGHIKGVSSKYEAELSDKYGSSKTNTISQIDGNYGGLTYGYSRVAQPEAATYFPVKYSKYVGQSMLYPSYEEEKVPPGATLEEQLEILTRNMDRKTKNTVYKKATEQNKGANDSMLLNDVSIKSRKEGTDKFKGDPHSDIFTLKLPDWNYADFINERAIWQKGLSSAFDEPGWFYFKIFFDFDTDHGLFGGLLNARKFTDATNSAAKYLYSIKDNHKRLKSKDRINALHKFASILSYINLNAPWYFNDIKNLNSAALPVIDEFSKERFIEIGVTQDAIDMRLSTLMSLYNYACFDSFLNKEVIPENLRQFNMTIILFQTPLRYLHTSFTSNKKIEFMGVDVGAVANEVGSIFGSNKKKKGKPSSKYKSMTMINGNSQNFGDMMSMKIYTFRGCEFDTESFNSIIPSSMTNEQPFQLGKSSIKIKYTGCTEHTMNEFYGMMWGTDGFYFNQYNNFQISDSFKSYVNNTGNGWEKQQERYKALKDTLDDLTQGGTILGLIDSPKTYKKAIDATEAVMNGLFDSGGLLKNLGTNLVLGALGSSLNTNAPQGNIYGDCGLNSAYYKDKLEMLKNGIHERTTAPYWYDPDTGVRHDLHKNKDYSSIDFNKYKSAISNFSVTNWLDTTTQKMASKINNVGRGLMDGLFHVTGDNTQQPYKPNQYNKENAASIDAKKWEGMGKSHDMVDNPGDWRMVQKPYNQEESINTDTTNEAGKNRTMVDDPTSWDRVQKPYTYDPKTAVDYENGKAGSQFKLQDLTDGIGNDKNQMTEKPFNYDPKEAVNYENSKAGDQYKIQDLTDGIGNDKNEVTETPYKYDPKEAVNYENTKAGDQYKSQDMVNDIKESKHKFTEPPYQGNGLHQYDLSNYITNGSI